VARSGKEPLCNKVNVACVFCAGGSRAGHAVATGSRTSSRRPCARLRAIRLVACYRTLMLKAMGDMCRATRLAIIGAVVSAYFLKCAVARCASNAVASS
jgi:hypothetical protein